MRVILNLIKRPEFFSINGEINIIVKNVLREFTPIYDIKGELMTKKEKEIFNWILERSWEKRANPMVIAAALALLFPDGADDVMKELEKDCVCKEN